MVALAVLALAVVRGLWIGVIREAFSLVGLATACVAVRFGTEPAAVWLDEILPGLDPLAVRIAAGIGVAVLGWLAVRLAGALLRRGVHAVGLGFLDRLAGGILGAAEGALVLGLGLLLTGAVVGRDHPQLAESRALAALERAEQVAQAERDIRPDVAAPPRGRER